jgi:hypothetical protein
LCANLTGVGSGQTCANSSRGSAASSRFLVPAPEEEVITWESSSCFGSGLETIPKS